VGRLWCRGPRVM